MKTKRLSGLSRERTWIVVFETGDEAVSLLQDFAQSEQITAAQVTAIGALQRARIGYFDWETKDYLDIPIDEQVEVVAFNGFITSGARGPMLHVHVALGRRNGSLVGGHLREGIVRPTLELVVTDSPRHLMRVVDTETGLPLIDLGHGGP